MISLFYFETRKVDAMEMPIKVKPFAHQHEAFSAALEMFESDRSRGYALLMEMGCGKSLTAVGIVGSLFLCNKVSRVLVVAPLSILGVWEDEFQKFASFPYSLTVLSGTGEKKAQTLRNLAATDKLQVVVVNYESAWRLEKEISAWNPDLILADEGHKLKAHDTNASKAMHKLGAKANYCLLLTGTVITNKALDVFSQYKFLNAAIFGNSFYSFRNMYFDMKGYGQHTPVLKKSMEAELSEKIHSIAYRATKVECLDLPDTTDIIRYVELEKSAAKVYQDLVKENFAQLGNEEVSVTNILTRLLRLSQITGGFLGGDENSHQQSVSKAKLTALADIIEEAQHSRQKLVIIARFISEIAAIKTLLDKQGIKFSAISGETKDRAEQIAAFQNDPNVTVFIGQIATAGLGITLVASNILCFYSTDYSMSNHEQARARIHRLGQQHPCTYIYLVAKNTIDEKVLKALRDKADLAKTLVDDYRNGNNPFQ